MQGSARHQLAVILVADLVGFSRLMEESQKAALAAIEALKKEHFEPLVGIAGGEVLKRMGDGWIVAFSSIAPAVQCAMDVQSGLAGHRTIKLRLAIHLGEIVFDESDFHGAAVNLTQRLQTEAPPGGLIISEDLHRQLSTDLARAFSAAGRFELKNIASPVAAFQWRPPRGDAVTLRDVPLIAVEPFVVARETVEGRDAVEDLRDQIVQRLSRRTGIRLIDESTTKAADPDYRLRGRLRYADRLGRFHLALIMKGEAGTVWSQTYEGEAGDVFAFCDGLIERADADLRLRINAFDGDRIAHLPDPELSVSELRSRAASCFYQATMESWEHALALVRSALELNPGDAMALAMHGEAVVSLAAARHVALPPAELDRLHDNLDRAVELMPGSDYAFWARGLFAVHARPDHASAARDADRVLQLSPAYAPGFELEGLVHLRGGAFGEEGRSFARAISLSESDPLLPYRLYLEATAQLCGADPVAAVRSINRAIQLRPNEWPFHRLLALCLEGSGDDPAAQAAEARAARLGAKPSILAPRPPLPPDRADLADRLRPG